ncbi:MAG: ABC transporter permease [Anaerolineae bacterium]
MSVLQRSFRELVRYPSAIAGLIIIIGLLILSAYALITIPYREAIRLWRGGEEIWYQNPKNAAPAWFNYFTRRKLSESIFLSSKGGLGKTISQDSQGNNRITISFPIDFSYDTFPLDLSIYFTSVYQEKPPHLSITWLTPDGREIRIGDFSVKRTQTFRLTQDSKLQRRLGDQSAEKGLFAQPNVSPPVPLKGKYELRIEGYTFEPGSDVDAEFVVYGQLHGLAGTDHLRRDLTVALLWGTPVALAFGLLAALGTTITTMVIAAFGVWFGGWVDEIIQRITEINLVLPFLPILIMVSTFYSRSIWLLLGVTILLSIFGGAIKTYRAVFLQVKESPYIEAARAYGASNLRIIFAYLTPRIIPMLIPQLVVLIPSFVFLEASLAVLGLGDPVLPTWGKIINDAQANGALYQGYYYWVLEPAALLIVTGLAFAMLGFSLDRIFNPRLRGL